MQASSITIKTSILFVSTELETFIQICLFKPKQITSGLKNKAININVIVFHLTR